MQRLIDSLVQVKVLLGELETIILELSQVQEIVDQVFHHLLREDLLSEHLTYVLSAAAYIRHQAREECVLDVQVPHSNFHLVLVNMELLLYCVQLGAELRLEICDLLGQVPLLLQQSLFFFGEVPYSIF